MNITLDFDHDGIWLIEETDQGSIQMGHIPWQTIANYLKGYL
jgi:hypothetical protein